MGTVGLALAVAGTAVLRHSAPANIPRLESIRVDTSILCFTALVSIGAGLLFGALPAMAGSHTDVNEALKQGSGKTTAGPQLKRWGNALVVGQIGLAIVLLAGVTLLLKSYWKLAHVESGLKSSGVFIADLSWPALNGMAVNSEEISRLSKALLKALAACRECKLQLWRSPYRWLEIGRTAISSWKAGRCPPIRTKIPTHITG